MDVASPISSAPRPVSVPQFSRLTAACTADREEPETPTITLVSISSRTGSVRTGGTSAGASAASEVEQVTPSALMVTYSFSCTAS